MKHLSALLLLAFITCACKNNKPPLETVKELNIEKYIGTWYEIARLPNRFEKNLTCITATYSLRDDGKISVVNKGISINDATKTSSVEGSAWVPDKNEPGKLKVQFFWPFAGDYQIIHLDANYRYALVGEQSREYLWILSKDKILDENIYLQLVSIAKEKGFAIDALIRVKHDC